MKEKPKKLRRKTMSEENNKPVATKKFGLVTASIWKNETADGKAYHSVTFERLYNGPPERVSR
jgi:hypothetical protein